MLKQRENPDSIIFEIMGWSSKPPVLRLLRELEKTGSINSAARSLGMQYKSAWQKIDQLGNLLPYALVVKQAGGSGGGGSVLTEEGKMLLVRVEMLVKEFSRFRHFIAKDPEEALNILKLLRRMEMKMSARNVWVGMVTSIDAGAVNSVVTVKLKGGDRICSVITDSSVKRLELVEGREVVAVVKASNVLLGNDIDAGKISAGNIMRGTIRTVIPGAVNDEVTVDLPGGSTVTAVITSASVKRLGLAPEREVSAIVKASDVFLAIA